MGKYVGIEMSDHLSAAYPPQKPKGEKEKKRKGRKLARASRRRNT